VYEASFGLSGLVAGLRIRRPNIILGVVPTLSGGVLARMLAKTYRVPYGLLFQDLMGPAAQQSGLVGSSRVASAITTAERWAATGASAVGVVTTSFIPYLAS